MLKYIIFVCALILSFMIMYGDFLIDGNLGIILSLIFIALGFYTLIMGGDCLVSGGSSIAKIYNIPTIVIGLTIVSFGTSAPEFFVNVVGALKGETDIVISNVIGSNLSNLLLILGASGIIYALAVKPGTIRREIPFSILATALVLMLVNDTFINNIGPDILSRSDGIILLTFFALFMIYIYYLSKQKDNQDEGSIIKYPIYISLILILLGMIGLYVGGELVVNNAVKLATTMGVSKILIGATIVAIGTSLPELAASVIGALKKQPDIAVGNIIGSNIFNLLWILGVSALISPVSFSIQLNYDIILLFLASIIMLIMIYKDKKIGRQEGIILIIMYLSYLIFVIYRG